MKKATAETSLLTALPIIVILLALLGAIVYLSLKSNFDVRSRASSPLITVPSLVALPATPSIIPEVACSQLYDPVCGANGVTYTSSCEAVVAKADVAYKGACTTAKDAPAVVLPSTSK